MLSKEQITSMFELLVRIDPDASAEALKECLLSKIDIIGNCNMHEKGIIVEDIDCYKCGYTQDDQQRFCVGCGTSLQ